MKYLQRLVFACLILSINAYAEDKKSSENLLGNYACTFTQDDYTYDPFTCVIKQVGDELQLEKISGSQRIKGKINLTEEGFDFTGTYFCPWGDCTSPATGQFKKLEEGQYEGPVVTEDSTSPTIVKLTKKK